MSQEQRNLTFAQAQALFHQGESTQKTEHDGDYIWVIPVAAEKTIARFSELGRSYRNTRPNLSIALFMTTELLRSAMNLGGYIAVAGRGDEIVIDIYGAASSDSMTEQPDPTAAAKRNNGFTVKISTDKPVNFELHYTNRTVPANLEGQYDQAQKELNSFYPKGRSKLAGHIVGIVADLIQESGEFPSQ